MRTFLDKQTDVELTSGSEECERVQPAEVEVVKLILNVPLVCGGTRERGGVRAGPGKERLSVEEGPGENSQRQTNS